MLISFLPLVSKQDIYVGIRSASEEYKFGVMTLPGLSGSWDFRENGTSEYWQFGGIRLRVFGTSVKKPFGELRLRRNEISWFYARWVFGLRKFDTFGILRLGWFDGKLVYRILFFKTSAARLDEIRVAYIIFQSEYRKARRNRGIKFWFQVKMHNMNRNILSQIRGFF